MSKVKAENPNAFYEKHLNFPDYKYPDHKHPDYNYPKYEYGRKEDMNEQS